MQALQVASVPSIVILDSARATRLAECPCETSDFKQVEVKTLSAVLSMRKRRSLLRRLADKNPNLVRLALGVGEEHSVPTIRARRRHRLDLTESD